MVFKKGNFPWNKGKIGFHYGYWKGKSLSEEHKRKISETRKKLFKENKLVPTKGFSGRKHTRESKMKTSLAVSGKNNPFYGRIHSEESRKKMSEKLKGRFKGKNNPFYGKRHTKEVIRKLKTPEFTKKRLSSFLKPNRSEIYLYNILQANFSNEFQYTGDGKVIINNICPDFINCNDKKLIIELFGDYWHSGEREHISLEEREKRYAEFGYKMLVIWESELKILPEQEIINKIRGFLND